MLDRVVVVGDKAVRNFFAVRATNTQARVDAKVRHWGMILETRVKANASGRPGPNAPTGDYRRSINTKFRSGGGTAESITGTAKPQGRRLEYGFVGIDSLGRHYNQPPYPHWRPARESIERDFVDDLRDVVTR